MKKNKEKETHDTQMLISFFVFLTGLGMIILFIFLAAQKFNEVALKPGHVIYNNPGVETEDSEKLDDLTEETEEEVSDESTEEEESIPDDTEEPDVQGASTAWWSYPDHIVEIPFDEVSVKTVVDKGHKLSENYVPENLITDSISSIGGIFTLTKDTTTALRKLGKAAQADGMNLTIVSSYRSYSTQASTYQYWVNYNGGLVSVADQISARPGHSEHQLGTAVDLLSSQIGKDFSAFQYTDEYQWLLENARYFGFKQSYPEGMEQETGYSAESWHWRWWGE